jgi:hypothetical protein
LTKEKIMSMRNDALFEAPLPHSTSRNGTAYAEPEYEFEDEWEMPDGEYGDPEFEGEWEMPDGEYGDPEFEGEWEMEDVSAYSDPEFEGEWEMEDVSAYSDPEFEDAAEYEAKRRRGRFLRWLRKAGRKIGGVAKKVGKAVLPIAGKVAGSVFGGPAGGMIGGALGSGLAGALGEAEMEVAQIEMEFFGTSEADAEVAPTTAARDAALAEVLAAQAAEAATEAEAEAFAAAALHPTITSMSAQQLRPYIPMLVQFYALLTKLLMQQGVEGQQLLRTLPHQQRVTMKALTKAARRGERIDGKKAVRTAAAAAQKTMRSGKTAQKAMLRNVAVQTRTARPPHLPTRRRVGNRESASYCPTCGSH